MLGALGVRVFRKSPKVMEMYQCYESGEYEGILTLHLTDVLARSIQDLTEEQSKDLQEDVCLRVYLAWRKFQRHAPGPERARKLHAAMDRAIDEQKALHPEVVANVSCRAGCSACCHWPVEVTADEAKLLAERIQADPAIVDREQLALHAPYELDTFFQLSYEQRRCPFLGPDRNCRVYDDRPGNCRKFYVQNDPALCADQSKPRLSVVGFARAEEIFSGALNFRDQGLIARAVLAAEALPPGPQSPCLPPSPPVSGASAPAFSRPPEEHADRS